MGSLAVKGPEDGDGRPRSTLMTQMYTTFIKTLTIGSLAITGPEDRNGGPRPTLEITNIYNLHLNLYLWAPWL